MTNTHCGPSQLLRYAAPLSDDDHSTGCTTLNDIFLKGSCVVSQAFSSQFKVGA